MKHLIFLLLMFQVYGSSITIAPSNYSVHSTLLFGKQTVEYNLTSTSPVSVFLMDSDQYLQFTSREDFTYDQICSRLKVTSANVSCLYFTQVKFQVASIPIYFVIENTVDEPVNVSYSLEYTYGFQYEFWGLFIGSVIVLSIIVVVLYSLKNRKRKNREEDPLIRSSAL